VEQRAVNPWTWQDNFGFSQGLEFSGHDRVLLLSGQTSVDADGSPLHAGDMAAQVNQAMDNLEAVLQKAGMTLANVVRLNLYTTDVDALFPALPAWEARLGAAGCKPSCTLLGIQRLFMPELMIEMEATAVA
jgi:enamine deaminase RidA (YjgF/YER057c/UK114 family)